MRAETILMEGEELRSKRLQAVETEQLIDQLNFELDELDLEMDTVSVGVLQ